MFGRLRRSTSSRTKANARSSRATFSRSGSTGSGSGSGSSSGSSGGSGANRNNGGTSDASNHFHRNQTLSSYRPTQASAEQESERQKAHLLALQRRRLGGIFLIVLAVVVLLMFLLWQLIAQVHITTSTKQLQSSFDSATYEAIVNDYLNVHP